MQKQNRCFFKHTSHCPHILRHQPADHQIMLVKILGMFHSVILADHTPLQIHSDGNCLYKAISRGMFGYEEEHELIRLLATLEIAEHREFYDNTAVNFIDLVKDNQIVSAPYTTLLKEAATLTHYSEMLHIYAVSAATGLALRSYCPPTINAEYLSAHLTRKNCGRRVGRVSIPALTVIWSQASVPATASSFKPNHFVLLGEPERRVINVDLTCSPQKISDTEWPELPSLSTSSPLSSPLTTLPATLFTDQHVWKCGFTLFTVQHAWECGFTLVTCQHVWAGRSKPQCHG